MAAITTATASISVRSSTNIDAAEVQGGGLWPPSSLGGCDGRANPSRQHGGSRGHGHDPHCDGRNRESRPCRVNRELGPARRQRHRPEFHNARSGCVLRCTSSWHFPNLTRCPTRVRNAHQAVVACPQTKCRGRTRDLRRQVTAFVHDNLILPQASTLTVRHGPCTALFRYRDPSCYNGALGRGEHEAPRVHLCSR